MNRNILANMKEDTIQLLVLTVFLLLYMIIGAGIFSALEQQNEQKLKIYYNNIFYTFAKDNNLTSSAISHLLKTHRESCLLGVGINQINKWDFAGSFYFTGTVITTIGKSYLSYIDCKSYFIEVLWWDCTFIFHIFGR